MRTQITWVLATYFTNKGFLTLLAFVGLFTASIFVLSVLSRLGLLTDEATTWAASGASQQLDVRPGTVISELPWYIGAFPAILAMGVGGMLARQFRNPASYVSPNFVRAHVIVSLLWLGIIAVGGLACTWAARQPLLPAFFFAVGMTGCLFSAGVSLAVQKYQGPQTEFSLSEKMLGLGVLLFIPLIVLPVGWYTTTILLAGWLLGSAGYAWRAYRSLRDLAGGTVGNEPAHAATFNQRSAMFAEDALESFLENWRCPEHSSNVWNRVVRWRAGNPRTLPVLSVITGSIVLWLARWILPLVSPMHRESPPSVGLGNYAAVTLLVTSFAIAVVWRKRLTCLDVESLRPMRRTNLQREWAASLASDLLPPALTVAAIATLSLQLQDEWFSATAWQALIAGWGEALTMLVVLTGTLWLATLACTSIVVVIERNWLGLTLAFGTFLLGGVLFGAMLGDLTRQVRSAPDPSEAIPLLLIPVAVSTVAIICMWRLWTRIDFDRRA